jgi:hypothetical protein
VPDGFSAAISAEPHDVQHPAAGRRTNLLSLSFKAAALLLACRTLLECY